MNVDTEDTPIEVYTYVMDHITREVVHSLSPMGHELGEGLYRVPVQIKNEQHTVYVGDNHKRMFDADSLPDFLKHKLAMIAVSGQGELLNDEVLTRLHLFATKRGDLECIGWRATNTFYVVVMTDDELESLKGMR
jgi:hypothetical protein